MRSLYSYFRTLNLLIAATSVSVIGAAFSISGLALLFSGAAIAVGVMASSLEFAKFTVASFLHHNWTRLNLLYRTYLLVVVVVLSTITSLGIFGFLSEAYQRSAQDLQSQQIKIDALLNEQKRNEAEMTRLNRTVEEIPTTHVSKRLSIRREAEVRIGKLLKSSQKNAEDIQALELKSVDFKAKVGPLIYIARIFNQEIDTVVKWLILLLVGVFDPLAICLVIAIGEDFKNHSLKKAALDANLDSDEDMTPSDTLWSETPIEMKFADSPSAVTHDS